MPIRVDRWLDDAGGSHASMELAKAANQRLADAKRLEAIRAALPQHDDFSMRATSYGYSIRHGYQNALKAVAVELHKNRSKWTAILMEIGQ
jgi:hypothetical protein